MGYPQELLENAPRFDHQCSQGVSQFSSREQLQGSSNLFDRHNADIVSRSAAFTYSIIHRDSLLIGVSFRDPLRGAMAIVSTQPTPESTLLSRNMNRKQERPIDYPASSCWIPVPFFEG
jgi:hypothetical protein